MRKEYCSSCGREVNKIDYLHRCECCDDLICDRCVDPLTGLCSVCLEFYGEVTEDEEILYDDIESERENDYDEDF